MNLLIGFVDKGSDESTLGFLEKSISPSILSKALDKTRLVQKEIQVQTKHGTVTRKQWVKAEDEDSQSKRAQLPATPFVLTEKTKHLVSLSSLDVKPEYLEHLDKPIPPTWRNVMVSPDPNADILVIGKDDMDRPQYIYSPEYVAQRKQEKFKRISQLIENRDNILKAIESMKNRETADCLKLILLTGIRPGSTRDTKAKVEALGASTLRGENVVEEDGKVYLRFIGKKGVKQDHLIQDQELANMLLARKQKSGDKGDLFNTSSSTLRKALKVVGASPKDFRTMLATVTAKEELSKIPSATEPKEFSKIRNKIGDVVCALLGNKRNMALNAYIDPSVFEEWSPEGMNSWKNYKNKTDSDMEVTE